MKKEITVKLLKNPENFIYKEEVFAYITMLEEEGRLSELPKNLFVYHVISLFADEVNNGGVEQYLENSSGRTYRFLRDCAEHLSHEAITPFLSELCNYIDAGNENFDEFDGRFYEMEKKHDFRKAGLKYYKENFEVDKIKIPVVKEKESENCAYFTVTEEEKCADVKEGLDAFLEVLSNFGAQEWKIYLNWFFNGEYDIRAISYSESIDLVSLVKSWASGSAKTARLKMCSYFNDVCVRSMEEGKIYELSVSPSGFEKGEYKIKRKFSMMGYDTVNISAMSAITAGRFLYKNSPLLYAEMKGYLENNYTNFPNVKCVIESGFVPGWADEYKK